MAFGFFRNNDQEKKDDEALLASSEKISKISEIEITDFDILRSLSSEYNAVYYANLDTGDVAVINLNNRLIKIVGAEFKEKKKIDEFAAVYANNVVRSDMIGDFIATVSTANLRKKMAELPVYTYQYIGKKDGEDNYFQMKASRINNSITDIVVGFADINSRINTEKKRFIELQSASNIKNDFLKNVSHELLTPLNAINGFTELALKQELSDGVVKDCVDHIHEEVQGLIIQIRNLITMDEFNLVNREPLMSTNNLIDLLNAMNERVLAATQKKKLHFTVDSTGVKIPKIITDAEFINRILLHLLYNAIKFSNESGTIILSVKQEVLDEQTVLNEIHVKDNGIGMSKEFVNHIFDIFSRERSSTEGAPPGMGLGMAITERLVKSLNGEISVVSKEGFGSDFKVVIPTKVAN
ncbi:MAG: HAMP domain-containing histidine kinase [Lachnospiraceae bacterium]|nr:HAMP domain-containing histidine kinase [Lachnospiraceae bacterium]